LAADKSITGDILPALLLAPERACFFNNFKVLHYFCNRSALTLFVTTIFTDDPHNTLAPYMRRTILQLRQIRLTEARTFMSFHLVWPAASAQHAGSTLALQIGFFHQTAVLVRNQVRLNLRHEVHGHYNNNQQ